MRNGFAVDVEKKTPLIINIPALELTLQQVSLMLNIKRRSSIMMRVFIHIVNMYSHWGANIFNSEKAANGRLRKAQFPASVG